MILYFLWLQESYCIIKFTLKYTFSLANAVLSATGLVYRPNRNPTLQTSIYSLAKL